MNASSGKGWPFDGLLVICFEAFSSIKVTEPPGIVMANLISFINPKSAVLIVAPSPMILKPGLLRLQYQIYGDPRLIKHLGLKYGISTARDMLGIF